MCKKLEFNYIILLETTIIIILICCIHTNINNHLKITQEKAEKVISTYLLALSNKDKDSIIKISTKKHTISLDDNGIYLLKHTLKSATLLKAELIKYNKNTAVVKSEVEIICYGDASPIGDWIPGKSISNKTFTLKIENREWKVDEWGS